MTDQATRFSNYLTRLIMISPLSQREIADAVGYQNQNMITMLKQGRSKLALDKVPAIAKALRVDPLEMLKMALTQSYDDKTCRELNEIIEQGVTQTERAILATIREVSEDKPPIFNAEKEESLRKLFSPKTKS